MLLQQGLNAAGQSDKISQTLNDKFWPTLLAGYAVWPLAHVINFRFIPNSQRVLYINAVNVSSPINKCSLQEVNLVCCKVLA